ncbi:MAG TPA: gluconate 2-dehydrogenase subunit 3 family protein [Nevskiaceae bacterium]|nr:gluconate 2-dehydrogenase subunit 3 family protein [Nevskiaceae bacterium]
MDPTRTTSATRRQLLQLALATPALAACGRSTAPPGGEAAGATALPRHLPAPLRATLEAVVERLIPGDSDPGAAAAQAARAIDALLGAFSVEPPFLFAGAPFSDRAGAARNDFARFLTPDPYEQLGWRLRIEGSQGRPEREFNGPVTGLQTIYREGLERLEARAAAEYGQSYPALPAPVQDQLLNDGADAAIAALLDVAFPATLEAYYGPPEYGGNAALVGWDFTAYPGDVQPRGWSDEQVVNADNPGPFDALLPPSYHDPARRSAAPHRPLTGRHAGGMPLPPASPPAQAPSMELLAGVIAAAGGSLRALRRLLGSDHA